MSRLVLSAILLLGLVGLAQAEPMTTESLESNRQNCVAACTQKADADRCAAYCECGVKGMASDLTEEEYQAGLIAMRAKQQPVQSTVAKLVAIKDRCLPELE